MPLNSPVPYALCPTLSMVVILMHWILPYAMKMGKGKRILFREMSYTFHGPDITSKIAVIVTVIVIVINSTFIHYM